MRKILDLKGTELFPFLIMSTVVEEKINALLAVKFQEEGFEDCYLVDVVENNTKLQVFIDSDSSLDFRKCSRISRYLEAIIDEEDWYGPKYTLEVSSPGATRPLIPRQYKKHVGRKVKVKLTEEKIEGVLEAVFDDHIIVAYKKVEKQGKKKIRTEVKHEVQHSDIKEIKVKLSF